LYIRCEITNEFGNVAYTSTALYCVLGEVGYADVNAGDVVWLGVPYTSNQARYQWQRNYDDEDNWFDVSSEVYSTLIVSATLSEDSAYYRCVISEDDEYEWTPESVGIRVSDSTESYYYTILDYFQSVDDEETFFVGKKTVVEVEKSAVGTTVIAKNETYDGYTRDTTQERDVSSGTIADDNTLELTRYYLRNDSGDTNNENGENEEPGDDGFVKISIALPNGMDSDKIQVNVSVKNLEEDQTHTVLLATYNADGKMLKVYKATLEDETVTFEKVDSGDVTTIKAFLVSDLKDITPLAVEATYPENGG
jgi:hypothetical protein